MTQRDKAVQVLAHFGCVGGLLDVVEALPPDVRIVVKTDEGDDSFLPVSGAADCQAAFYAERHHFYVALDPHRARRLSALGACWITEDNPSTARLGIDGTIWACDEEIIRHAVDAVEESLRRSLTRLARARARRRPDASQRLMSCPQCGLELPMTGLCDDHGRAEQRRR